MAIARRELCYAKSFMILNAKLLSAAFSTLGLNQHRIKMERAAFSTALNFL